MSEFSNSLGLIMSDLIKSDGPGMPDEYCHHLVSWGVAFCRGGGNRCSVIRDVVGGGEMTFHIDIEESSVIDALKRFGWTPPEAL